MEKVLNNIRVLIRHARARQCHIHCRVRLYMEGKMLKSKGLGPGKGRARLHLEDVRFGKLVVNDVHHVDEKHTYWWNCTCDCGRTCVKRSSGLQGTLKDGGESSCGICKYDGAAVRKLYNVYRRNAEKQFRDWKLTLEEFKDITSQRCYYTGVKPEQVFNHWNDSYTYNGIDRLNNEEGYTINNCVPCSKAANFAKGTMSYTSFIALCKSVASMH